MYRIATSVFALAGLMLAQTAMAVPVCRDELAPVERCPVWAGTYNHLEGRDGHGEDIGRAIEVSPSGDRVYISGQSYDDQTKQDQAVAAFDSTTGQQVWSARYETSEFDTGSALVATDGSVFVTGRSGPEFGDIDWATAAYDAATGQPRWVQRRAGPKGLIDGPQAIGASLDGSVVYVTGGVDFGIDSPGDILTVAYDAENGRELWSHRFDNGGSDGAYMLEVAPDGETVYVLGESRAASVDAITLAYAAGGDHPGELLWSARLDWVGQWEIAEGLAISADGERVGVVATSVNLADGLSDYVTGVFDSATGVRLWRKSHNGTRGGADVAGGVAIADDAVVVTGRSSELPSGTDYGTIAYDLETGNVRWTKLEAFYVDAALDISASPDGEAVYVTGYAAVPMGTAGVGPAGVGYWGELRSIMTAAYDVETGERTWLAHHNQSGVGHDTGVDAEVSPDGERVYLGGTFVHSSVRTAPNVDDEQYANDFAVLAYDA